MPIRHVNNPIQKKKKNKKNEEKRVQLFPHHSPIKKIYKLANC